MKYSIFSFALLLSLLFVSASCDSQKTNSAASATAESAPMKAMTKGNPEPIAGVTIEELDSGYEGFEKAYFAGGCFWCTEASFYRIAGVEEVWSGYAGGAEVNPTYKEVASGTTSHAEAIVVYYDPEVRTYEDLLDIFFVAHDPTTLNRQGPDRGTQYRSAIFPINEEQRKQAEAKIAELNKSTFSDGIVTTIEEPGEFYIAEAYHQDYYEDTSNPNQGYVQNVSRPKVEKVMKVFKEWLKPEFLK
ncbi:peptide-methionine (S)-S-oxide reductase MsrA [Neolewinella aurantiaca]|uniref:Peptide methionine sulfoxide reductase MsrA n=1 Tax=Neolewinella aurantiaca TaxID=2602767 RepID=A0A5C7FEB0_9BACT|nr:peptide-methionine (S)-S-oxide reductase MsrA [Neolewinella aurantiaca]TXF87876.1 peptide-methionine (S)-S-oxide reductase MsrA [Neolewinella aurantiaca]